ncbi:hypothetical protein JCM5350_007513 [Sporobolomyces pararoseus]
MPTPLLPNELYTQILSNLDSSTRVLYNCLFISRTFCSLVKPLLYQHITIKTRKRRLRLLRVKKEDKRLVEKLTISGEFWIDPAEVEYHFEFNDCALGKNVVTDLLTGKLLDITAIKVLHISKVHEDPREVLDSKLSPFDLKPALKLVELSINCHQGGGRIWDVYLGIKVPSLRRLAYVGVSEYYYYLEGPLSFQPDPEYEELDEVSTLLPPRTPYSQLQVLVAAPSSEYHKIQNFPHDNFLAFAQLEHLSERNFSISFPNCCISHNDSDDPNPPFIPFFSIVQEALLRPDNRIVSLFLPRGHAYQKEEDYEEQIESLESKGVKVFEAEEIWNDESNSLIFKSLVQYLEKNGKLLPG